MLYQFKKFYFVVIGFLTIGIFLAGCFQNQPEYAADKDNNKLVLNSLPDIMPTRFADSENKLSIFVDIRNLNISNHLEEPHTIVADITFTNISNKSIIFREPTTFGFDTIYGENFFDLSFLIEEENGNLVIPKSSGPQEIGWDRIKKESFILMNPEETCTIHVELPFPDVYINKEHFKLLPFGSYKIKVVYVNSYIGYKLPLANTPSATFESVEQEFEWIDSNQTIVDLKAWVGTIESDFVEFSIVNGSP